MAPVVSPAIGRSRRLLPFCAEIMDCYICTISWPACAWCASSGKCMSSPANLLGLYTKQLPHLLLSQEEHQKSYGKSSHQNGPELVESECAVWITAYSSCGVVEQYCTDLKDCAACTTVPECGFCYADENSSDSTVMKDGRCIAGTQSGELLFRSLPVGQRRCAPLSAASAQTADEVNDNVSFWFFGNWSQYYISAFWENKCIDSHCPRQQRFETPTGRIGMGHAELLVSYAAGVDCSWEISPDPWPEGEELIVTLFIDDRLSRNGMLSLSYLDRRDRNLVTDHVGCWGSMSDTCDVERVVRSSKSMRLRFQSSHQSLLGLQGDNVDRFSKSVSWTAAWKLAPVYNVESSIIVAKRSGSSSDSFEVVRIVSLVAIVVATVVLLLVCLLLYLRGYFTYVTPQAGYALPGFAADVPDVEPIDLNVVEQAVESFRSYIIQSTSSAGVMEPSEIFCSVCLMEFEVGHEVRTLACNHSFHKECGDTWFTRTLKCPLCRQQVCHWPLRTPNSDEFSSRASGVSIIGTVSDEGAGAHSADNVTGGETSSVLRPVEV